MPKSISTLENEIISYANGLPYWGVFLSEKIMHGKKITDTELYQAYAYVLEDLGLLPKSDRPTINLSTDSANLNSVKSDIYLSKLSNIEGVNALSENQQIEFSPNLTVIFGNNGCGKSGYTRLFKRAFYSKTPEDILPNIFNPNAKKLLKADFSFTNAGVENTVQFPEKAKDIEFRQFAVFDGKSILKHLDSKNIFEFRPAGLSFFGTLTDCIKRLEALLVADINKKNAQNNFAAIFDGDSEIKEIVTSLSAKTNFADIKKYLPFSDEDKRMKVQLQKEYDDLFLASKSKERDKSNLTKLRQQLETVKITIAYNNRYFSDEHIKRLNKAIEHCKEKEKIAHNEGVSNFTSTTINDIGSLEWKEFIVAAEKFALQQTNNYPTNGSECIFCHQKLSTEAAALISNYWKFIKSAAEKDAKDAIRALEKGVNEFEKLNYSLFLENSALTIWLTEFHQQKLEDFIKNLTKQKSLANVIINTLQEKTVDNTIEPFQIPTDEYDNLISVIEAKVKILTENAEDKRLNELKQILNYYLHKEKLELHFAGIEQFVNEQVWIAKANKMSWPKRNVTDTEKYLSAKFFNQRYIDTFNAECKKLNGNFGIVINHTGAAGTSYKQLFIEGLNPVAILSEGEQNVIGLSDFLSEMKMSEINRGIIFDDPVTSLDHERRETIAVRLAEEAATKQVIVFTHDIFFMFSLKYHAEQKTVPFKSTSLFNIDKTVGLTRPNMPWIAANVNERKGYLKNDLVRITKLQKTTDPETYRNEVKTWCGMLREAWERCIEERLFKGVISRFAFGVETQKLKYINISKELIDEITAGMTETSKWVHDQAVGVNSPTPQPSDLERMIKSFDEFISAKCKAQ